MAPTTVHKGKTGCPCCSREFTELRVLRRHVNEKHLDQRLSRRQLDNVDSKYCTGCNQRIISTVLTGGVCRGCGSTNKTSQILGGCSEAEGPGRAASQESGLDDGDGTWEPQTTVAGSCADKSARKWNSKDLSSDRRVPCGEQSCLAHHVAAQDESDTAPRTHSTEEATAHNRHITCNSTQQSDTNRASEVRVPYRTGSTCPSIRYAAKTVPKGAHELFSEFVTEAINRLLATASAGGEEHARAQKHFMHLVSQLLGNTNGSKSKKRKMEANVRRLRDGEVVEQQHVPQARKKAAEHHAAKQVHAHLKSKNVSAAARVLEAAEVAPPTPEVLEKLSLLHPVSETPEIDIINTVPVQITREQLQSIIQTLPEGKAPGPSGWTYDHIKVVANSTPEGMDAVLNFVNAVLTGDMPQWDDFRASRLIPLYKTSHGPSATRGVRPIAIGEAWARLVSTCAMQASSKIGPALAPLQVGVGIKGGATVLGQGTKAGIMAHEKDVTLQLDFKNAFNSLSRQRMLEAVAKRAPQLVKYALWMYQHASHLWLADHPTAILSRSGVRQGDPCGPLFFSLTLQDVLEMVQEAHPQVRTLAYLDDTFLQGPVQSVVSAYRDLKRFSAEIDLTLRDDKCGAYSPTLEKAQKLSHEIGCILHKDGMMAAGCPVGSRAFAQQQAHALADKVVRLVDTIMELPLPSQDKLLLLRKSLQVKLAHLARCAEFVDIQEALLKVEQAILKAVLQIIGRDKRMLDIEQLYLPMRKGGLGLLCLTAHNGLVCKAGFVAAAALAQDILSEGCESLQPFKGQSGDVLQELWTQVNSTCTCKDACACDGMEQVTLEQASTDKLLPGLQRATSSRLTDLLHHRLLKKYQDQLPNSDTRINAQQNLARLHSVQHSVATAWLSVLPSKPQWEIHNDTIATALRFMLGVSPGPSSQSYFRCACGYKGYDSHHAMTCKKLSGVHTLRHNRIQNSVRYACSRAGCDTSYEPKEGPLQGIKAGEKGYGKRGDILVTTMEDMLNVDISVIHPAGQSIREQACKNGGAAAKYRERQKRRDHEKNGTPGYQFIPFSVESYGRLGEDADRLLKDMAERAASTGSCDRNGFLHWMRKEISLSLIRGNARIFSYYLGLLIRGTGVDFQEGATAPTLD